MPALITVTPKKMLPHFFAILQLALLVTVVISLANSPIPLPGGKANGALKVITPFHLWVLILSLALFALFYRIREEGLEERCITLASLLAVPLSAVHFALYFIDGFLLWMWATGNIATALYLTVPIISLYKVSVTILAPILKRAWEARQHEN